MAEGGRLFGLDLQLLLDAAITAVNVFILFIPVAMTRINNKANQPILQGVRVAEVVMPTFFVLYFFLAKADSLHVFDYKLFF